MQRNQETTEIAPFTVSDEEGFVRAIISPKLLAGALAGGAVVLGVGSEALAHDDTPPEPAPLEVVQEVVIGENSSPWKAMKDAGYTDAEAAAEMELRGITEDIATQPIVHPGDLWPVSPVVQQLRAERLGMTAADPVIVTLTEPNDSYWEKLHELGIDEHTEEILAQNGISMSGARSAKIGDSITIPGQFLNQTAPPETVAVALGEDSSIIEELVKLDVANPDAVAEQIMQSMGISEKESRRLPVGEVIRVPANAIPQPNSIQPQVEQPQPVPSDVPSEVVTPEAPVVPVVEEAPAAVFTEQPGGVMTETLPLEAVSEQMVSSVYVLGDSLAVGTYELGGLEQLLEARGIDTTVYAETSRSLHEAVKDISPEQLGQYDAIIVSLGTNAKESNERFRKDLSELIANLSNLPHPPRVLVSTLFEQGDEDRIPEAERNAIIQDIVSYAQTGTLQIEVLDWHAIALQHPEWFEGGDGIHPTNYAAAAELLNGLLFQPVIVPEVPVATTVAAEVPTLAIETVGAATYAEYLAAKQYPEMPEELRLLKEQADAIGNYNERIAAKAAFMKQYSEWLASTVTLTPEGYALFLQSGVNTEHVQAFSHERPVSNGETIDAECVVKHWMAGMPNTVEDFAAQMKYNVQFAIWGDGTVYQMVPEINSKAYHAAGVNNRCIGMEMWGEYGTDFTHAEWESSMYLDMYLSQTLGFDLIRDVAAIEQSTLDSYGDFYPSEDIIRNTTYLTHKSVDRVFAKDPVGKVDIPEYMANWSFLKMQAFRFQADAILVAHNTSPATEEAVPPEVETAPAVEEPAPESPVVLPMDIIPGQMSDEQKAAVWAMDAETYVQTFNAGQLITVQLRGEEPRTAHAEIQKYVDIVWRLENGRSPETVVEALTVSLAESGWNNAAMNKQTGDRCWFQINKINRDLVANLGYNYDTLQDDPLACVRVAFALFELSEGFKYSASYVDKWEENYGLKLPPDLHELVNSGFISHGWQWWLMSARKTGVL